MNKSTRWTVSACAAAAMLAAAAVCAVWFIRHGRDGAGATGAARLATRRRAARRAPVPPAPAAAQAPKLPPRIPFTAADEAAAVIPGMPDARFWADSTADFNRALPSQPGPWLMLSTGGSDGAFGAGLLNGLSAAGNRPDYSVVTGVSTGALMAPFVFAGSRYDDALKAAYTQISAADIFEVGGTGESFVDSWPLKDLIAKQITPALLADIAAEYQRGRRLFVVTTDIDAERSVVWNMGAIAAHGGDAALNLFRSVLLASGSVPGAFPPVLIDVEVNGKRFAEMHVDGGVGGQFFVAPAALMESTSGYRIPATQLYIVINSGLEPEFQVVATFDADDPHPSRRHGGQGRPAAHARPQLYRGEEQRRRLQRRHHSGKLQRAEPRRLRPQLHESLVRRRLRPGQKRNSVRRPTAALSGRPAPEANDPQGPQSNDVAKPGADK